MSNRLYRLGRFAVRRRRVVVGAWLLALVLVTLLGRSLGGTAADNFQVPGTESQAGRDVLKAKLSNDSGSRAQVVLQAPAGHTLTDATVAPVLRRYFAVVRHQPHVVDVGAITSSPIHPRIGFAFVTYRGNPGQLGKAPGQALDAAAAPVRASGVQLELGGEIQIGERGLAGPSEKIGMGMAVIVLLVAFGSVVAMGLPIGTALIGLGSGLGLITVAERFIDVPTIAPTLAAMIGLGVGIDYALFIVTRHREHLRERMTVEEAAGRSIATAGQAVLFAGITVVIAICGLQFVGIQSVALMGYAIAVTVLVAVAAALTLLPAFLGFAGHNIDRLRIPFVKTSHVDEERTHSARWSKHVSRHPWRYLILSSVVLGLLIVPFSSIRLGQTDAGNDPAGATTRKAYDLLAEGFGAGFNGPLAVVVERGRTPFASALPMLTARIKADHEVAFVAPDPAISKDGNTALLTVFPKSAPQDANTQSLVHRLRSTVLPQGRAESGVQHTYVTGSTAFFIDISDKITSRLPIFIGAVLVMSFVLLMMVFRSILVPLKAALMNLVGIAAAYGVLVAIFQWKWGAGLFGVDESLPIISFLPMFMFAILFGLSMDYEVFLMSRVHEEYLRTRDNTRSVAKGISHTARVITAAAVIMVSVFGSFAFGDDPTVKMFGVGLATAIFLDATLIRMVLVPSTMQLLGDRNWWLPGWLERHLPHLDLEGEAGLPAPEYEPEPEPQPSGDPEPEPEPEAVLSGP